MLAIFEFSLFMRSQRNAQMLRNLHPQRLAASQGKKQRGFKCHARCPMKTDLIIFQLAGVMVLRQVEVGNGKLWSALMLS